MVNHIRCSQEKVSCGKPCGRPLGCGFHPCEQLCHAGACAPCTANCGKPRKLWYVLSWLLYDVTVEVTPELLVSLPNIPAPILVMLPLLAQKLNRATRQSPSIVRVDAFSNLCSVGAIPQTRLGARLPLPRAVRTNARSRSATLVLQRHSASILIRTKRIATLHIRTSWLPLPSLMGSLLNW